MIIDCEKYEMSKIKKLELPTLIIPIFNISPEQNVQEIKFDFKIVR